MTTETLVTDGTTTTETAASQTASTSDAAQTPAAGTDTSSQAQPGSTPPADKPADGTTTTDKTEEPATKSAGAPEKYEAFKLADGALDASEVAQVEKLARELNLPQDAAQKLAEQRAADKAAGATATQQAIADARAQWVTEVKNDKEIGGDKLAENLALAKRALAQFDTPDKQLAQALEKTGFGDSPAVVRFLHRVGKAISEDRFVPAQGSAPAASQSIAKRLFPNMNA